MAGSCEHGGKHCSSINSKSFITSFGATGFSIRTLFHGVGWLVS